MRRQHEIHHVADRLSHPYPALARHRLAKSGETRVRPWQNPCGIMQMFGVSEGGVTTHKYRIDEHGPYRRFILVRDGVDFSGHATLSDAEDALRRLKLAEQSERTGA